MQRICRFTVIVAAVFFCVTMILGTPAPSRAADKGTDHVQTVTKKLHDQLKITPAQEEQWGKVAQVMQENSATMQPLVQARKDKQKTMNAVEDLKSYGDITEAHAAGLKKFVAAFEPLYAAMSDDQKKTADSLFKQRVEKHMKKKR